MKRFIIALCVLYLVSIFALAQGTKDQAPQPDAKLAKELMAIHQQWLEARKRGDTETMARTLGDEWTITTYNGHIINKEQGLADAKTSNQKDRLENAGRLHSDNPGLGETTRPLAKSRKPINQAG
jgi:hypothetical protein